MDIAAVRTAREEVITENTGYSCVFVSRSNNIIIYILIINYNILQYINYIIYIILFILL